MKRKNKFNINYKYISIVLFVLLVFSVGFFIGLIKENNITNKSNVVVFKTNYGTFEVLLNETAAPKTVENFRKYVNSGFYNGLIFHRVIPDFVIQGGGFYPNMTKKKTLPPIPIESNNGLSNKKYTIAMARTTDPNSATSQFFINLKDNNFLDYKDPQNPGYTVFGKIISGFDVINKIAKVNTTNVGYYQNVPVKPVIIEKVYFK